MTYDGVGNVTSSSFASNGTDGRGLMSSSSYSADGNRTTVSTDENNISTTYGYGTALSQMLGAATTITDANNTVTTVTYDDFGRTTQTGVANQATLTYTYGDGNLSAIKRETGNRNVQNYELSYYDSGDLEEISVGGRTLMVYTYDTNNGLPEAQVYGNVASIFYTYDNLGRLKTATYDDGRVVTYTYNGEGQLYSVKETGGDSPATYLYTYDIIGNLVASEKKNHNGNTVMRVYQNYDDAGQLVGQTWYVGNTKYSEGYTYNTEDGSLSAMITGTGETVQFSYDDLQRLATSGNGLYTKSYSYRDLSGTRTTSQVSQVQYTGLPTALNYGYTYDSLGNIATYSAPGKGTVTYTYDTLGQLLSAVGDQTYMYTYDSAGNILTANGHTYTYGDSGWKDLLTAYDGQTIAYDDIGNPYSYYNGTRWNFSWENGRSLAAANNGTTSISYAYDANGLRTGKTVGNVTHNYIYASGQLLQETYGDNTLDFFYDASGHPYSMKYNGTNYYYITNLQGDVMYLVDAQGNTVASYDYDPYGNILSATGAMAEINPLRYRGYYYDTELEMYYLQSRYYDPQIGRFINLDTYISTGQGIVGFNMFAYCNNSPVNAVDPVGNDAIWLQDTNAVYSAGHTGLLIQDADGKWWHFYWGNNRNGKKGKSGEGNILLAYSGKTDLTSINAFYKEHYGGKYEASIYFSGDFSKSVTYAKKLSKKYNLIFNNCMEVSCDVLRQGKFSKNNGSYRTFLLRIRGSIVPNVAYKRMLAFHITVVIWQNTPWYLRDALVSPGSAAALL